MFLFYLSEKDECPTEKHPSFFHEFTTRRYNLLHPLSTSKDD
nr:MAG TPA: hypothetical protein [Caudoviricetes sp.]